MASTLPSSEQLAQYHSKVSGYMKIFYALIIVTIVEVAIVFLPIPRIFIDLGVVGLSISKAFLVGYFYMHLNHETMWTKIVALLPICMFFYAVFLVLDGAKRPASVYVGEPARVFKGAPLKEEAPAAAKDAVDSTPEAPATSASETPASPPAAGSDAANEYR